MEQWPDYACAILEDCEGRLLLEARLETARHAAGKLTCFGGRREAGESPEVCLRRELREELNWEPKRLDKRVELHVAGQSTAWFFHAVLDGTFDLARIAPGHRGIFIPQSDLARHPVSPWHAATLAAWFEGRRVAELES